MQDVNKRNGQRNDDTTQRSDIDESANEDEIESGDIDSDIDNDMEEIQVDEIVVDDVSEEE